MNQTRILGISLLFSSLFFKNEAQFIPFVLGLGTIGYSFLNEEKPLMVVSNITAGIRG